MGSIAPILDQNQAPGWSRYSGQSINGSRIFEVDLPATQQWKLDCLNAAGIPIPASLTFVPTDFESSTLSDVLAKAGFRSEKPAFFSWLGVTMYLEEEAIMKTLRFIAFLAPGTALSSTMEWFPHSYYHRNARC